MSTYQVVVDTFKDVDDNDFTPGLAWVYGNGQLELYGGTNFPVDYTQAVARLDDARARGWTDAAYWNSMTAPAGNSGGNGYTMLRSKPVTIQADSALDAGMQALAHMGQPVEA